jgi:dTDP-4-dehydrorhamnose 3,5-epimerase
MHFHLRQWDLWCLIDGRAHVALVDLRAGYDKPAVFTADVGPGDAVVIPPGVAHGFQVIDEITLLYLVTREYDGTDENSFRWNDPDAEIKWPYADPVLSERDSIAGSFRDAVDCLKSISSEV